MSALAFICTLLALTDFPLLEFLGLAASSHSNMKEHFYYFPEFLLVARRYRDLILDESKLKAFVEEQQDLATYMMQVLDRVFCTAPAFRLDPFSMGLSSCVMRMHLGGRRLVTMTYV